MTPGLSAARSTNSCCAPTAPKPGRSTRRRTARRHGARTHLGGTSLAHMVDRLFSAAKPPRPPHLAQAVPLRARWGRDRSCGHFWEQAQARWGPSCELDCGRSRALELDEHEGRVRAAQPMAEDHAHRAGASRGSGTPEFSAETAPIPGDFFHLDHSVADFCCGRLLPEPARAWSSRARGQLAGLDYLQMILVCLVVRRPNGSRKDSWLYFPEPHLVFNRAYEAKNFDAGDGAIEGRSLLCLEITHRAGAPIRPPNRDESLIRHGEAGRSRRPAWCARRRSNRGSSSACSLPTRSIRSITPRGWTAP